MEASQASLKHEARHAMPSEPESEASPREGCSDSARRSGGDVVMSCRGHIWRLGATPRGTVTDPPMGHPKSPEAPPKNVHCKRSAPAKAVTDEPQARYIVLYRPAATDELRAHICVVKDHAEVMAEIIVETPGVQGRAASLPAPAEVDAMHAFVSPVLPRASSSPRRGPC